MEFIIELIAELFLGTIFNVILSAIFEGIYHAALFYRFGLQYLKVIKTNYDNTLKGKIRFIAFSIIMFFWVGVIACLVILLVIWGITYFFA